MMLIGFILWGFTFLAISFWVAAPKRVRHLLANRKYLCSKCNKDVTRSQKFQAGVDQTETLEGRQV